jgi:hypothetical protein
MSNNTKIRPAGAELLKKKKKDKQMDRHEEVNKSFSQFRESA